MEHLVSSTARQSEENEIELSSMDGTQLVPSSLHGQYTKVSACLWIQTGTHMYKYTCACNLQVLVSPRGSTVMP